MRDPERIDVVLGKLKTLWEKSPDLRFLQLLYNLQRSHSLGVRVETTRREKFTIGGEVVEKEFPGDVAYDGFNVEDETLLEALDKELTQHET